MNILMNILTKNINETKIDQNLSTYWEKLLEMISII